MIKKSRRVCCLGYLLCYQQRLLYLCKTPAALPPHFNSPNFSTYAMRSFCLLLLLLSAFPDLLVTSFSAPAFSRLRRSTTTLLGSSSSLTEKQQQLGSAAGGGVVVVVAPLSISCEGERQRRCSLHPRRRRRLLLMGGNIR